MRRTAPWPTGTPCWLDVITSDLAATRRFYGELFGWQGVALEYTRGEYVTATLDGTDVAGMLPREDGHPPVWNVYLAVTDVDATAEAVVAAGGTLLGPVWDVGDRGRTVVAQDPTGGVFCLWQARTHPGCAIVNEPGAFVWSELLTRDHDAAVAFYETVFGMASSPIGGDAYTFSTLSVDGDVVGGVGRMPDAFPAEAPAHWRVYFASPDTDATVDAAVALGAMVTIEAHDTPFGRWAALVDPVGARFCVITPPA